MSGKTTGSVVGNQNYRRGFKLIELKEGEILFTYVDNQLDFPLRSPVVEQRVFQKWHEAINFMKIWAVLAQIRWW
jgi:hypothetical protein